MSEADIISQQAMDANWQPYLVKEPLAEHEVSQASLYVKMRDGIRIAVTYYLPKDMPEGQKIPTILRTTRYWRAIDGIPPGLPIRQYLANGYAWASVDARGTGASFGRWSGSWSPEEIKDYNEVVNWIIRQPWSDGIVGTLGGSYEGTTADMIVRNCNSAVKAAMPLFAPFDVTTDIAALGGILLDFFIEGWGKHVAALDRNEPRTIPLGKNKTLLAGVLPVDEDHDGSLLDEAVSEHIYNYDSYMDTLLLRFKDDFYETDPSRTSRDFNPYGYVDQLRRSQTPIYSYSGYGDGGDALGAIHRFRNIPNPGSKLVLGRWAHGSSFHISPYVQSNTTFNHLQEQMRFFDQYLKGIDTGIKDEAPVHYYTMVEEKWHSADTFPPPTTEVKLYFQADHGLDKHIPEDREAWDEYLVDYSTGTGERSRWNTLRDGQFVTYPDRREADQKLLCYNSSPIHLPFRIIASNARMLRRLCQKKSLKSSSTCCQFPICLRKVTISVWRWQAQTQATSRGATCSRPW